MAWYIQLVIYIITCSVSFFLVYQIDFNKFMRLGRKQYAIVLYVVVALVIGFALGFFLITLGNLITSAQG